MALDLEQPVFVIDLAPEGTSDGGVRDASVPPPPDRPIELVALLWEDAKAPLLLPISPTTDVVMLDALARLIRAAVALRVRVPKVAAEHGDELERRLLFERRLPLWAIRGLEPKLARQLPRPLRRVLGQPRR